LTLARFDLLAGRLLRGVDHRELLEQKMDDIVARDGRVMRFSRRRAGKAVGSKRSV
jgi:hypothetical protein